ncbi:hypothetical protein GXW83_25975 [Streptacidiphilus sp. PB12-B1b]|uniref:hypothetical protein n=1 Tax=Streptacidiphilus sp. PB12-B1b TaxID=2705012 RepID=UPI0015FC9AF4|nr:hypothetical protein [Streptacidiphilus sp. PB12-B1b]QMU78640.1 hypothetical protein GXW83_25975 [Streptacidiphilus sp. PB12-B1b]
MDLDPESVAALFLLVPAAAGQLWRAERMRAAGASARPAAMRWMRLANRLMALVLLVNLLLGTVATLLWAEAGIDGSAASASPPLLWPLLQFAAGIAVSIAANARASWSPRPRPMPAPVPLNAPKPTPAPAPPPAPLPESCAALRSGAAGPVVGPAPGTAACGGRRTRFRPDRRAAR